jgi:hypothetical protein
MNKHISNGEYTIDLNLNEPNIDIPIDIIKKKGFLIAILCIRV